MQRSKKHNSDGITRGSKEVHPCGSWAEPRNPKDEPEHEVLTSTLSRQRDEEC